MPVDTNSFHPIIQAFMQARNQASEDYNREADRTQRAKMQEDQLKQQEKIQKMLLDVRQKEFEAEQAQVQAKFNFDKMATALDMFSKGAAKINEQSPTQELFGTQIPTSLIPNASDLAARQRILLAPKTESEVEIANAGSENRAAQAILQNALNEQRDAKKFEVQNEQLDKRLATQEAIADKRMAAVLAAVDKRIAAGGNKADLPPEKAAPLLRGMIEGQYTVEDLPTLGVKPEARLNLIGSLEEQGYRTINKKDRDNIAGLAKVEELKNLYKRLADRYAQIPFSARLTDSEANGISNNIEAQTSALKQWVGESGVLSNQDVARLQRLHPRMIDWRNANQSTVREMDKILESGASRVFKGMRPDQEVQIRKRNSLPLNNLVKDKEGNWHRGNPQ